MVDSEQPDVRQDEQAGLGDHSNRVSKGASSQCNVDGVGDVGDDGDGDGNDDDHYYDSKAGLGNHSGCVYQKIHCNVGHHGDGDDGGGGVMVVMVVMVVVMLMTSMMVMI